MENLGIAAELILRYWYKIGSDFMSHLTIRSTTFIYIVLLDLFEILSKAFSNIGSSWSR